MSKQTNMNTLDTKTMIHVGVEVVVIGGIAFWVHKKTSNLQKEIEQLKQENAELKNILVQHSQVLSEHHRIFTSLGLIKPQASPPPQPPVELPTEMPQTLPQHTEQVRTVPPPSEKKDVPPPPPNSEEEYSDEEETDIEGLDEYVKNELDELISLRKKPEQSFSSSDSELKKTL